MNCIVNGKTVELTAGITVGELLKERELKTDAVVIELNRKVLERSAFKTTVITEGMELEILSFVGGGLCE